MFDLTTTNEVQTMTSREIAELVESRHSDIMRSITRLATAGIIRQPPSAFSEEINNLGFKVKREYFVFSGPEGKRDSIVVVAQNCPEFTARLVDRWQELEQKQQVPALNLNDPAQLRGLLTDYVERVIKLEEKVVEDTPKVEFVDNYVEASGLLGFREMCKLLGIKEYVVRDWLVSKCIIYKLGGKWAFAAAWLDAKRGEHKTSYDAYGRAVISIKFTPRGFAYIAERISK
jgi:phage regulator Rha-like protein